MHCNHLPSTICVILVITFIIFSSETNADNFTCSGNVCALTTLNCVSGEHCYISCLGGGSSCRYSTINCPNDANCVIDTDGSYNTLASATINGGNNTNLFVSCDGIIPCSNTQINCPTYGDCHVSSSYGTLNFYYATIMASSTTNLLSINILNSNSSLYSSAIYCPPVFLSGSQNNCIISASGGFDMLSSVDIYALESLIDLSITCEYTNDINTECYPSFNPPTLYCGLYSSPTATCDIILANTQTYDEWQCKDTASACNNPLFSLPPTQMPTNRPSNAPVKAPTNSPTQQPTNNPSEIPTSSPLTSAPTHTISPTQSPSNLPTTQSPSYQPTYSPTISVDLECNINSKCNQITFNCEASDECRIDCKSGDVCNYSYFNCPDNYDCYVNMHSNDASLYTNINGGINGSLYVECYGSSACEHTDIRCPSFGDCVVTTSGGAALYYSDVRGNENTGIVSITAIGSITGTDIYCPPKKESGPQHNCIISVSGGTGMISSVTIYALESFTDFVLTCDHLTTDDCYSSYTAYQPELICGPTSDPISSCIITLVNGTNDQWRCRDEDALSKCQDLTFTPTESPSFPPTFAPTQPPSASPTQAPSISPTNAPSQIPSLAPSNAPILPPTNAPSKSTSHPTAAPTIAPSLAPSNAPTATLDLECNINNLCNSVEHYCTQSAEDCHIECGGSEVCGSSRFYCPDDYDCYVSIKGDESAQYTRIVGGNRGNLYVDCSGYEACYFMMIECPSFGDCIITSSGTYSMAGANIESNANTNILSMVSSSGNGAFSYANVYCPEKYISGSQNNCIISVSAGELMLHAIEIYSLESFTDFSLTCNYSDDAVYECYGNIDPKLFCGPSANSISSCSMRLMNGTNNEWECISEDALSLCQTLSFSPTKAPTYSPTNIPSLPSQAPTFTPTNTPTSSPSNTPTQPPTYTPSEAPSSPPSAAPTMTPTQSPSDSPTPHPTFIADSNENIVSNFVMNYNEFGITNFRFPAAVNQCMNQRFNSDTYMKYECVDDETVKHTIYDDDQCEGDEISVVSYSKDTYSDIFVCNGTNDTFIEFSLFPNDHCAQGTKTRLFMADGVCTSYGSNEAHYKLYCVPFTVSTSSEIFTEVWFQYYTDQCSIYGFHEQQKMDEGIDECTETEQAIFGYNEEAIYMEVVDCYTIQRSYDINMQSTEIDNGLANMAESELSGYDVSGYAVLASVILFPIILIMIGYFFHKKRAGSDRPEYFALFTFFASVGDFYTDLLWSITLYSQGNQLYIYAFVFIFGPHILSICVGIIFLTKWRQNKSKMYIAEYALRFDKVIIISTFWSGFYATTDIVTSHLFHLDVLSLQLDAAQKTQIGNLKIFNTIILENLPCLIIQFIYLQSLGSASIVDNGGLNITILAMAFSVVSIIFGVLTVSVRLFNEFMDGKKESNDANIEFIFKSSEIDDFKQYHVHSHEFLSKGISHALHLQRSQVEILYIRKIPNGIKVSAKMQYLEMNEMETITEQLTDDQSELFGNFRKECIERLQIQSSNRITLNISKLERVSNDSQDVEKQTTHIETSHLNTDDKAFAD